MPNFIERMMSEGMASDYDQIQALSKKVYDIVASAKEIRVTTPAGTDLTAKFDPKYRWIVSDGNITAGHWSNLPDGEVFTQPVTADGTVVVDGCFGDFFNKKYGDIGKTPLSYELKDSRCQRGSVRCDNAALKEEFEKYTFETDENSDRLGEFAIGTNVGLTGLIGNLLQDEKFPGIHLALGSPYPDKTGAEWDSQAHNDGILRSPTIIVDGKPIMKDGKFLI
jgi:leucyl aminopeptidase (aminopeptidase T)